ncbi:MAG: DUF882 domain-containing protein [Desulfocapsaceae bacterium]|nr:DUF882 domain-containing protein [Desulfocapsaceae bacterium]
MTSAQLALGMLLSTAPLDCFASRIEYHPLTFYHTHTGENLQIRYSPKKGCSFSTQRKVNEFLRDFRTEQVHPIDPQLLEILTQIQVFSGSTGTYEIISGYRSPETNHLLRERSAGVAQNSFHMQGKAIDIRLTDVPTRKIQHIAIMLRRGGVGYYPESDFVHIDTGDFRTW